VVLKNLIEKGVFDRHQVMVWEQMGLLANKSMLRGLWIYLRTAGWDYTTAQIIKQLWFQLMRFLQQIFGRQESCFYPYYHNRLRRFSRETCPNLNGTVALRKLKKYKPELVISIFSRDIIPPSIFSFPKLGTVNLHPALLPKYKGVSPVFWCLAKGEKKTGITLHYVDRGIDTGKIITQKTIPIFKTDSEHTLYLRCAQTGVKLLIDWLRSNRKNKIGTKKVNILGSYFSLPTKQAVQKFRSRRKKFI